MLADEEGFLYPQIDKRTCISCDFCSKVCPIIDSANSSERDPICVYASFTKDSEVRVNSSSGGVFSTVAQWILKQNGIVFGADFDQDLTVHHIKVDNIHDLYRLRGSKYLQSRIEETYMEARDLLEHGRTVLFSGTGCQIAGLKHFLNKDYDNLFTVDVLCHGVPSPKVWKTYLQHQEDFYGSKINLVSFRNKKRGWHGFSSELQFTNGKLYSEHHSQDQFMRCFLSDICLRPSCHRCEFRSGRSGADLTLGDAWGIEKWMPEMDDDKGTSLVLINSMKGKRLWHDIASLTVSHFADFSAVVLHNKVYRKSVMPHPNRKQFFRALNQGADMSELVSLTKKPLLMRCIGIGKTCIKRLLNKA